jgi:hypothetical protein
MVAAVREQTLCILDNHHTEDLAYSFHQCLFRPRLDCSQQPLNLRECLFDGALIEAMGRALDAVTAEDTQGFFEHCGYRFSPQPL